MRDLDIASYWKPFPVARWHRSVRPFMADHNLLDYSGHSVRQIASTIARLDLQTTWYRTTDQNIRRKRHFEPAGKNSRPERYFCRQHPVILAYLAACHDHHSDARNPASSRAIYQLAPQ